MCLNTQSNRGHNSSENSHIHPHPPKKEMSKFWVCVQGKKKASWHSVHHYSLQHFMLHRISHQPPYLHHFSEHFHVSAELKPSIWRCGQRHEKMWQQQQKKRQDPRRAEGRWHGHGFTTHVLAHKMNSNSSTFSSANQFPRFSCLG